MRSLTSFALYIFGRGDALMVVPTFSFSGVKSSSNLGDGLPAELAMETARWRTRVLGTLCGNIDLAISGDELTALSAASPSAVSFPSAESSSSADESAGTTLALELECDTDDLLDLAATFR